MLEPGGRLLIVDFAPHEHEFLRETQQHERLGFDAATVSQWLMAAGLKVDATRSLAPHGKSQDAQLTVSLWLASRPPLPKPPRSKTKDALERTA